MSKIYEKYIFANIGQNLILTCFVLTFLAAIPQVLKFLPLIDKGISFIDFLRMFGLILPFIFFVVAPIACCLSVVFFFFKMLDERQLIVFKTVGLSNWHIARPAIYVAMLVAILSYFVSFYLLPVSYNQLKKELNYFKNSYFSKIIEAQTFHQLSKELTVFVHSKSDDGSFSGITLFDNREPQTKSVIYASNGFLRFNNCRPIFELQNGNRQSVDKNRNFTKLKFDAINVEIDLGNNAASDRKGRNQLELFINEMLWPDESKSAKDQLALIADGHQRLIWPIFSLVMPLMAVAIFLIIPISRRSQLMKYIVSILLPLLLVTYIHFTTQNAAHKELFYIVFCYGNCLLAATGSLYLLRRGG